ncbi:MAG: 50S ribosomal protein L4 [Propionibacteriaceae bacterium]
MSESVKVDVLGADKKKSAELPAHLFDVQTNVPLIHQVVVAQQAAARQGTQSTKHRGEVRGGGIKPWRQKGTGRARQGSRRAPQWTGGGVVHGPKPRSYAQRTPKKMIAAALRGVLSDRVRDGKLYVLENIVAGELPSTKAALTALSVVGDYRSAIVVLHRDEDVAWLSLRNLAGVHAIAVDQLNVYDVLVNESVVFTSRALEAFISGRQGGKSAKAVATSTEAAEVEFEVAEEKPAKAAKAEKAPKAEKPATAEETEKVEKPAKAEPKAKKAAKATDEEVDK